MHTYNFPFLRLVSKGQVHEGILHNSDKGSVITWDFDVMRHDVVFTVYRLKIPLPINSIPATMVDSSSSQVITSSSANQQQQQLTKLTTNNSTIAITKSSPQTPPSALNGSSTKSNLPAKNGGQSGNTDTYNCSSSSFYGFWCPMQQYTLHE